MTYTLKAQLYDQEDLEGKLDSIDKSAIQEAIRSAEHWAEDYGTSAGADEFEAQIDVLQAIVAPITSKLYASGNSAEYTTPNDELKD